ncbi:MAG TPA: hypothetical protein PK625_02765 [Spirochaetales bacterium]|nr:hypothetical protein [Spirochaetales bacterium]
MPNELDVYQVLKSFAQRNKLNVVDFRVFALAVQRQAKNYDQSNPYFRDLALHPEGVLVPKLLQLAREKRISVMSVGNQLDRILLPEAFTEPVYAEYRRMEDNAEVPFPDEESLKLNIPSEWIQAISVENDLPALIDHEGDRPVLLYRLIFSEGLKSAVALAVSVGDKLLEYAALKLRHYLRKGSNKDYIHQRMVGAFVGKELLLKEGITTILIKPYDAIQEMRHGKSDFTYPFWAYLSSAIKKDLSGKGTDLTPDDVAVYQSAYIIDVYNNHYKGKSQRSAEREAAFKTLGMILRRPPYLYSIQEISDFRDHQSRPLLGKYTREELEEWLHTQTTRAAEGLLPDILVLATGPGRTQLVAKDRFLQYLVKALHDARSSIRPVLINQWKNVMYEFGSMDAMESDDAFRLDLRERVGTQFPVLLAALDSRFAPGVYSEMKGSKDLPSDLERLFGGGRTATIDVLLDLDRKHLVTDVKVLLPFWYTVPVLSWIIGLFKRSSKKKQSKRAMVRAAVAMDDQPEPGTTAKLSQAAPRSVEFAQAARQAEKAFLPEGYGADEYLRVLESRWNTLLDPRAKANLTEDVNSLVRDYLRGVLRTMKPSGFTPDRVRTMAENLADSSSLIQIRNHSALEEYLRLYMIKVLKR